MTNFAQLVEEFREQKKISKRELTIRSGLSSGYISLLTLGERTSPSEETVARIADALMLDTESRSRLFEVAGYTSKFALPATRSSSISSRQDWGEAPDSRVFYGRNQEIEELAHWIVDDRCRMVAVLGRGGMGKTLFAVKLAEKIQEPFKYIFWRSLQNALPLEDFLRESIQFLSNQLYNDIPDEIDKQISLLIGYMQNYRCLIILDNFETVLQANSVGQYRDGYEGYSKLLKRLGEGRHQSCLLLTSREKPKEIANLEGNTSPVRSCILEGLQFVDGKEFLKDKGLQGTDENWLALIGYYSGNPLALMFVSQLIREVFEGDIASFLHEGNVIFSDIRDVLDEQFNRLSPLEQEIMYWLAIEREAISPYELMTSIIHPLTKEDMLESLNSLKRRFMIENRARTLFTLQPVIMEYMTNKLIYNLYEEVLQEKYVFLMNYPLIKASVKDYIRNIQLELILKSVAQRFVVSLGQEGSARMLKKVLVGLQQLQPSAPGYAAGNVLNLLINMNVDLHDYNFSNLNVWEAYLRGISLRNVDFTSSDLSKSVFTDTFGSIFSVALNMTGELLAAGTANGEIRIWTTRETHAYRILEGHTEWVRSVAFSPFSNVLISGSEDQTIRIWDISTGECLNILKGHTSTIYSVVFSPDGRTIASGSDDQTICLWKLQTESSGNDDQTICLWKLPPEQCLKLEGHESRIFSVAFSSDGKTIASGSGDRTIRLWDVNSGTCLRVLSGHTNRVRSVAFSPDGKTIASGSGDRTIRLWDVNSGTCLRVLSGHTDWVWSVAFSPAKSILASGGDDKTIRLWNSETGECLKALPTGRVYSVAFSTDGETIACGSDGQTVQLLDVNTGSSLKTLQGYSSRIYSVAFHPNEDTLVSGGEDGMVRLWYAFNSQNIRELHGHTHWVWSVCFSPNGLLLASGSEDRTIRIWKANTGECLRILNGHANRVYSVAFSPDGKFLASSSGDQTIRLWDVSSGEHLKTLSGQHNKRVYSVAFSPDGKLLASSSGDQTIRLWDVSSGEHLKTLSEHTNHVRSVNFSPEGSILVSGGDDQKVVIWNRDTGKPIRILIGCDSWVWSVAFSPDGKFLASSSEDRTMRLWDVDTGNLLSILRGDGGTIYSVAFNHDGGIIATGSHEGIIEIWDTRTKERIHSLRSARPYEGMKITKVKSLSDNQKIILKALGAIEDGDQH